MNNHFKKIRPAMLVGLMLISVLSVKSQQVFSFDSADALTSNNGGLVLRSHSIRNSPELTNGIVGKGFRTDGYSTWLSTKLNSKQKVSGVSGWFALESFPTDTAAFFALKDSLANTSISVCVDKYGELFIETGHGKDFSFVPANYQVERFRWMNIALSVARNRVNLWINGKETPLSKPFAMIPTNISELCLAKDVRESKVWMSDVTIINGLVDEIKLWNNPIDTRKLQQEVSALSGRVPVLAIPESRFKDDFSRPKYHLLPDANWTNETHGLIYYNHQYHIFNQKNASNLMLRQINWGHFTSPDLINWTEQKPILRPEPRFDQNGIWSGHLVLNNQGIPAIFYSAGGDKFGIGMALPKDSTLLNWKKFEGNPVILGQPEGYTRTDMHDPYLWKVGDKWYMCIGFGIEKAGKQNGALLLYSSLDLKKWNFQHLLFEGNPEVDNSGVFWEMPVFRKMGDKYILLVNKVPNNGVPARAMYWVGDFKNEKFVPDNPVPKNLEVINRLLSPSVATDKDGLTTAIAIIPDEIGGEAAYRQGWSHLYSIPRVWNLKEDKISQSPHPALKELRETHKAIQKTTIESNNPVFIDKDHQQLEVQATIVPNGSKKFGFVICENADNSEFTKLYYDAEKHEMVVDQTHSSLKKHIPLSVRKDDYTLDVTQPVDFHIFMDGSVVEVFINNEDAFSTRIFPSKKSSNQVEIFSEGGNVEASADVWILRPAKVKTDF
jgi:Beta-fructosidases (levanase/invertase)